MRVSDAAQRGASMALTKMVARAERGEIEVPRLAAKVMQDEPGAPEALPGTVRPTNRSEAKRWAAALELWGRGGEELPRDPYGEGAELASRMAEHTRIARERGFGEAEHLALGEVRQRPPVERERENERDAPVMSR